MQWTTKQAPVCRVRGLGLASLAALMLAATACKGGSDGTSVLISLSDVAPGSECEEGGHQVDTGVDADRDGELSEEEVEHSAVLCNGQLGADGAQGTRGPAGDATDGAPGADGFSTLTALTALELYDDNCPWSGVRVDAGLDNGAGGGTARDGVLQNSEVTTSEYVCEPRPLFVVQPIDAPEGDEGTARLLARGGTGRDGSGGSGGDVEFYFNYGSQGGHVKLYRTGSADASFEMPTPSVAFGDVAVDITSDTTVQGLDTGATGGLAEGDLFTQPGINSLFRWNGAGADTVTGIHVAQGATLTVEPRFGTSSAYFRLTHDVHNEGTIRTGLLADGVSRGSLTLYCPVFYGAEGSTIDASGDDGDTSGGNGGNVYLDGWNDNIIGYAYNGRTVNMGTIVTSGGDGDAGGSAGQIRLQAGQGVHNTGTLTALGGTGTAGNGGSGGYVNFYVEYGYLANSADIDTSGGDGSVAGGSGGSIEFEANATGHIRNSGDLTADGGDGAAGSGGSAGDFDIYGYAVDIITSGVLSAQGGDATTTGSGGSGGYIYIYNDYNDGWYGDYVPPGNIEISGDWNTSGGDGESGGSAGDMDVYIDADYVPTSQELIFYGYTNLVTRGGNGTTSGGSGGDVELYNEYAEPVTGDYGPSGGIINHLNVNASGGNSSAGFGGGAGSIDFYTDYEYGYATEGEIVVNTGDLTARGGDGELGGGDGDYVEFWGYNMVDNSGDIDTSGGDASGDGASAGDADYIYLLSELGPVVNTGALTANGGEAMGAGSFGGEGYEIEMLGTAVHNSGMLSVAGGDANETDGTGGDAGYISLFGADVETDLTDTSASIMGGAGNAAGEDGTFLRDSFDVSADF